MSHLNKFNPLINYPISIIDNKELHELSAIILNCKVEDMYVCSTDSIGGFKEYYKLQKERRIKINGKITNSDDTVTQEGNQLIDNKNNKYIEFSKSDYRFMLTCKWQIKENRMLDALKDLFVVYVIVGGAFTIIGLITWLVERRMPWKY